jgi:DNA-binding CsgD family transcriptional regulator
MPKVTAASQPLIKVESLKLAIEQMYDAALIGDGWSDALEALSCAAGSRGVAIIHNRNRRLIAAVGSKNIAEPLQTYLSGKAPPNSRQTKVSHDIGDGFRTDFDDYRSKDIAHDPFYQDYLKPIGLYWHANARLVVDGSDEVAVSFKRELKHGAYEQPDKKVLDQILPHLRACARIAECVFDAEIRGSIKLLQHRGRPVIEFDAWGAVRRQHGRFDGSDGPLTVKGARTVTAEPQDQVKLEKAIHTAVSPPYRQASVLLNDLQGNPYVFQIVPVVGRARDVFLATNAIGVLIGRPKRNAFTIDQGLVVDLFRLTYQEARVASLVCGANSTIEIASALAVTPDTVRFHLKSIFEKTAARNRSELVSLFAMLAR